MVYFSRISRPREFTPWRDRCPARVVHSGFSYPRARGIFQRVDTYSVEQTSKILGRTKSTIRKYLNAGELKGEFTDDGWRVSQASVHERKENLERGMKRAGSQSAEDAVERLAMQLGRVQAIKELTGLSEANLKAERDRLREALDEERERRIRAEAEIAFLKAPKPRSWVGRFFGL